MLPRPGTHLSLDSSTFTCDTGAPFCPPTHATFTVIASSVPTSCGAASESCNLSSMGTSRTNATLNPPAKEGSMSSREANCASETSSSWASPIFVCDVGWDKRLLW